MGRNIEASKAASSTKARNAKKLPSKLAQSSRVAIKKPEKPASLVAEKLKQRTGPKWNLEKLAMGQYLSETSYYTVIKIYKNDVDVRNQRG